MIKDKQWKELREKYFNECTDASPILFKPIKINTNPHNLFEWFKKEIEKLEYLNLQ